ncbi:TPA: helix-turn-helix domain-containing protein [Pluralibacter gergoviae]|uniref:IclR family transcriptional regulator n=1 Tax=Pluralibacter gergoviae TaxID=61647 RepID=A0A0J5LBT8_PLUGE|nr:IclR family transcriptional regulator C-terminal domain-containing protein [Pluralibacter gergoviae]KMK16000.1 IclR family transcriptional regulator [Pluralibacter gergoviae]KMK27233.1 IclR family transcriptional regulator [Pluralibacter gergoviae]MBL3693784.1 helix-turn-helix domain-containing protein [Pluralibacter gergoviae]HDS1151682.1 helix-turn-helix domain-containing protein [Pluralibacter gergoviae]
MQNNVHQRDLIVGLQKGLAIIQLFSKAFPRLTVPQVAKMSGLTPSAARRFLLTLLHERYLQTDGRHYWLTPRTLRLGQAYVDSARFPRMVRPVVEYIASRTGEHASVGVIDDDELVYIARSKHTPLNSTSVRLGERVPIYCTAGGRLWLATLSEPECEAVLKRIHRERRTPYTITDIPALMEKIDEVRALGYACIEKEFEVDMLVVAVPLSDREGEYWGALSLTSHQSRTTMEALCRDHLDLLYSAREMLAV